MGNLASVGISDPSESPFMFSPQDTGTAPSHPGLLSRAGQILTGIPGGLMQLGSDVVRLPFAVATDGLHAFNEDARFPALSGMGHGVVQTGMEVRHPSTIAKNYSEDPLGSLLNDAGNVGLGAGALSKVGILGAAGADAAGGATIAGRLEQISNVAGKVTDIPMAPWRYAITSATEHIGQAGLDMAEAGRGGALAQGLARFSPNAKALQNVILEGNAAERRALEGVDPNSPLAGALRANVQAQTADKLTALPFTRLEEPYDGPTPSGNGRGGSTGITMDELGRRDREQVFGTDTATLRPVTASAPTLPTAPNPSGSLRDYWEGQAADALSAAKASPAGPERLAQEEAASSFLSRAKQASTETTQAPATAPRTSSGLNVSRAQDTPYMHIPSPNAREVFLDRMREAGPPAEVRPRATDSPSAQRPDAPGVQHPPELTLPGPMGTFTSISEASNGRFGGEQAENTMISQPLAKEMQRLYTDPNTLPGARALGQVLDPANRLYRKFRMDLNPGWAVGQVPGNAVMGAAQSAHPLQFLGEYARSFAKKDYIDDPRINHTATVGVQDPAAPAKGLTAKVDSRFPRAAATAQALDPKRLGFAKLADRADNASRSAFFRTEVRNGASEAVAREKTLRQMGEFDKRNAVEQAYVRRAAPFYTWNREVVKMTAHLAEEHPVRFATFVNAGRVEADSRKGKPGSRVIDGGFLVPYGQSGGSFGGALFGAGKMLGPLPKFAAMVGTGDSMSSGKDLRVGQAFGQANSPGLHNSGAAIKTIAGGVPIGRFANAVKGENRYQTGPEAGVSLLSGIDVSHNPSKAQLQQEKDGRAADRAAAKQRAGKALSKAEKASLAKAAAR